MFAILYFHRLLLSFVVSYEILLYPRVILLHLLYLTKITLSIVKSHRLHNVDLIHKNTIRVEMGVTLKYATYFYLFYQPHFTLQILTSHHV